VTGVDVDRVVDLDIWLNAFACIRPSEQFLIDFARDILRDLELPGELVVRVHAS
jgi:hypothetical protein